MRLAHISDLHLLSLDGSRWLDFANKRVIGGMNLLMNRGRHHRNEIFEAMVDDVNALGVDHVVCTGDVTNLALEPEFRFAREHFERFALSPEQVTVIPGNHDAYVSRGAEHFQRFFATYFRADDGWDQLDEDPWPAVRIRGPVAVLGLSTSMQTPWFTAFGRLGSEQLERLERMLADPRLADKLRIVAIHHPPAGTGSASRVRGLHDRARFARVLFERGAELVLHGHEHRDMRSTIDGPGGAPIPVRGIQSATYEDGQRDAFRARYRVYEVAEVEGQRPRVVSETLRVWKPDAGRFSEDVVVPANAA